jgi:hypothetical protein
VAVTWEKRNAHRYLVGNSEGKGPLGRPMLTKIVSVNVHWILPSSGQKQVAHCCEKVIKLQVP